MFESIRGDALERLEEQAAVLALVSATKTEWHRTADLIEHAGGAHAVLGDGWVSFDQDESELARVLKAAVKDEDVDRYRDLIQQLEAAGVRLVTIVDPEYPKNLREIFNRPPFLFYRGDLRPLDEMSVAVVGTRKASEQGLEEAAVIARGLVEAQMTVVSGLAAGIDTVAHRTALEAGGRTLAVTGTGIQRMYPAENGGLAKEIVNHGAVLSQFWPTAPPTKTTFPMRNITMSGLALGTIVVEAGETSGAKMQAGAALRHGRRVFLLETLVLHQEWAQRFAKHPGVTVVTSAKQVLRVVEEIRRPVKQLRLA